MSNDKFQDKYNEVFQSLKEEKMNWDFEDFLQKAESKVDLPIIQIRNEKKSLSKWVWMAACAVVVFGLFLVLLFTVRFIVEFVKESQGGFESALGILSTGQWLSIPFIIVGLYFIVKAKKVTYL